MPSTSDVVQCLRYFLDSLCVVCLLAIATTILVHRWFLHQRKHRFPAKLPTHLVLVAISTPQYTAEALAHISRLGVPFITLVGLTLDALEPYLPGMTQLSRKRGEAYVEFSWECAPFPTLPFVSRFRWMGAEDGRVRIANRLKHLIRSRENVIDVLSDSWPLPCLAVVESTATCLNGTDTLPIRQADLHFVSKLNSGSVMQCLHAFARGEQRFGK